MFTSSVYRARGEEDVVTDPVDLLGKRMDFQIRLVQCLGTKWLKEDAERGVQMGYQPVPRAAEREPPSLCALVGGSLSSSFKNELIVTFA